MTETWYRYEDVQYAGGVNEFGDPEGKGPLIVHLRRYNVVKHTPKGVWLNDVGWAGRFVRNKATKKYAHPTMEEAKTSFIYRKKRQITIHQSRVERAEEALKQIRNDLIVEGNLDYLGDFKC